MSRSELPIVGSNRENVIHKINAERTVNWYEVDNGFNDKKTFLHPWWGKKSVETFSELNKGRATFVFKNFIYFVVGDTIYRSDETIIPVVIQLNFFLTLTGHIGIAANQHEIIFIDGQKAFLWNTDSATGTDITANLPLIGAGPARFTPYDVTVMDGYFILISQAATRENRFYISGINNGSTWNILDFALINSRPTFLNAVSVLKRQVFFFGLTKSELWGDAGEADFPFRRNNTQLLEHGVFATSSVAQGFDRLFYLSGDANGVGSVMMVEGTTPEPISTLEMDEFIQSLMETSDAEGFVFKQNGMIFYQINFTEANVSFAYNVTLSTPEDRKWNFVQALNKSRDALNSIGFFNGGFYGTSYLDNRLFNVSHNYFTNDGEKIRRQRIMRILRSETYEDITYNRIQIDMLKGVGSYAYHHPVPGNSNERDPVVFLSVSEDGGVTYFSLGDASFGKAGDRLIRIIWLSIGRYRDLLANYEVFDEVPCYVLGGSVDFMKEPE